MSGPDVEEFYDDFNQRLLRDYFVPNARVSAQFRFLLEAIPLATSSILIVGCGTGEVAGLLAERFGQAQVLALDLSQQNIDSARALFAEPRIDFQKRDILSGALSGSWDVIVFPDSYEHIPTAARSALHAALNACLAPRGRVLLACPTVMKQRSLRQAGHGLQPIDEDVTLEDVQRLARDVQAEVTHFSMAQIWGSYDYFYAVVERDVGALGPLTSDSVVKLHRGRTPWRRVLADGAERLRILRSPLRTLKALRLVAFGNSASKARASKPRAAG